VSDGLDAAANAVVKAGDIAGVVASYSSLTAIRRLDSVEADPKAVEACDYLRGVITAWKRADTPKPAEDATAEAVAKLEAELAALKAKVGG
jgi:hypothetical protein